MNTFSGHIGTTFGKVTEVRFSLDAMQEKEAAKVSEHQGVLTYSVNLGRLPFGKHAVTIGAEGSAHYGTLTKENSVQDTNTKLVQSSMTINFVVDEGRPTAPPSISLLSPTNTTYYWILNWTHIPYVRLEYNAEDTRLSVGYSFDGDNNIIPANNGTTLYIPIQSRRLTLYATDAFGNNATPQTAYYEILRDPRAQRETSPLIHSTPPNITLPNINPASTQDFSVVSIVAGIAVIAVATAGLVVYFNKRKRKKV